MRLKKVTFRNHDTLSYSQSFKQKYLTPFQKGICCPFILTVEFPVVSFRGVYKGEEVGQADALQRR